MIAVLLIAAAGAPGPDALASAPEAVRTPPALAVPEARACGGNDPSDIVVCGRPRDRYRIDPSVLQAIRVREAVPAKPELGAGAAVSGSSCIGPNACQGDFVPLVGMALTVMEAAALAAQGEDWRDAFRTRPDEYQAYRQAEERRARQRRVTVSVGAGNQ